MMLIKGYKKLGTIMYYEELKKKLIENPKNWLITGVAGFIGSNLLEALLNLNQNVLGLDNFSTGYEKNLIEVKSLVSREQWEKFDFVEGDICDLEVCRNACKGIDVILHQAALGSVPRSIKDPIATNKANIDGFLNILVAARDVGVKRIVYAASSSTYGDHPDLPKVEDKIGQPLSPYAVTKYVNELYAGVFARTYGIEPIGLRYFNIFGKRQNRKGAYAAVIPSWINALLSNQSPIIYGDGKNSRDFCYVENAIQANLLASITKNKAAINQVFNVAVGDITTLDQLYEYIVYEIKNKGNFEPMAPIYEKYRIGDLPHSQADIQKAQNLLNYKPTHNIKAGLKETILSTLADMSKNNKKVTS